jgi:putative hydrolases of HD superfamily
MEEDRFSNFLRILELYKLKQIPRNSSNHYEDEKDNTFYQRRETTAEHVYSCLRLSDYFLSIENEFTGLDRLKVYGLLMYHDDLEIITRDTGISERKKRAEKKSQELAAVPILSQRIPRELGIKFVEMDKEYRAKITKESKFANAVDKMDALVHEFQYPSDWGPKGFDEKNVRNWFSPAFEYSPTFKEYFERIILYLDSNGYFDE